MKQEQNSFSRLWTYLRAYRLEVCLSIFLKILSVVMSVVEPFVLGLAITELTKNLMDMAKGLPGAGLNTSYIAIIMTLYLFRGVLYELGSYYSNYFMTNAVQKPFRTCEMICPIKSITFPFLFLTGISSEICSDVLLAMSKLSRMPCNSPFYKSSTLSLPCSLSSAWSCT